jgi:hypothetical protein
MKNALSGDLLMARYALAGGKFPATPGGLPWACAEADGRYLVIIRVTDSVIGRDVFEECVHDTDDVQEATSVAGTLNANAYEEAKPYRARG